MTSRLQSRRLVAMAFLLAVAFACLGYRLVELQVFDHERLREASEESTRRVFLRAPKRGEIRDIRGNLLAGSVFVKTVCGNPAIIGDHRAEVARTMAPLLQVSEAEILQRLRPRLRTNDTGQIVTNQYAVLKHKVLAETWEQIQLAMQRLTLERLGNTKREVRLAQQIRDMGIFADPLDDQIRDYPNKTLAAHILGCVGVGEGDSPAGKIVELQGRDGIELTMDAALKGVVGWRNTEVAKQKELVAFREQNIEARPGRNVILTIDSGVQHIVEAELAEAMAKHSPISASALAVRPRTGEILGMACLPSFDPNNLTGSVPETRRNRMISDLAEPGSTFKIVVVSGALNDGAVALEDRFDCENGLFVFAGRPLHDHEKYGVLSVEEIITHSSNIGAAKVGIKMGADHLYQYIRDFGFGTKTGLPMVGEVSGVVHPLSKWTKLSISRIPMGHEVAVTQLQMVMAMCAVANGGRLMRPMLVDRLEDPDGRILVRNYPQMVRQVVGERAAHSMVTALKTVVSTNGTGKKAMLEHYTVAGKTGTAQKLVGGVYRRDKHFSSFIGFFPADNPELCIAVFLDEPKNGYYGGEAAAPVFRDIAERVANYLAIKADILPQVQAVPMASAGSGTVSLAALRKWKLE